MKADRTRDIAAIAVKLHEELAALDPAERQDVAAILVALVEMDLRELARKKATP